MAEFVGICNVFHLNGEKKDVVITIKKASKDNTKKQDISKKKGKSVTVATATVAALPYIHSNYDAFEMLLFHAHC